MKSNIDKQIDYIKPDFAVASLAVRSSGICYVSPTDDDLSGEGEDFEFDD